MSYSHSIKWIINKFWINGIITCHLDPDAPCHTICSNSCEMWENFEDNCSECGQPLTHKKYCNAVEWFETMDAVECYDGPETSLRDCPISCWYDEGWHWKYEDISVIYNI